MNQRPKPRSRLHKDGLLAIVMLVAAAAFAVGFILGRVT